MINQLLYEKNTKYLKIKIKFEYLQMARIISKYYINIGKYMIYKNQKKDKMIYKIFFCKSYNTEIYFNNIYN